ncbi:MAG: glycosyltransferase [Deltaproteobacteria bacterium]|nr:glycosyltransferase [Deltaproteobacteria bacterium]
MSALHLFCFAAALLWASTCGYLGLLHLLRLGRRRAAAPAPGELPAIAVVVPLLNEKALVAGRLADLDRTAYPPHRMRVVFVDGGSTDGTRELLAAAAAQRDNLEVWDCPGARSKPDQINLALDRLTEEIVVFSDADAELEPQAIHRLVERLTADPRLMLVGARVTPQTPLVEERLHWWLLNRLWWLQGEALGGALLSGLCYACRRTAMPRLPADAIADDMHLALSFIARGLPTRLCWGARGREVRTPQTPEEMLRYRRFRGNNFRRELRRFRPALARRGPVGWACLFYLWHFRVTPLAAALFLAAAALSPWPLVGVVLLGLGGSLALTLALMLRGFRQSQEPAPGRRAQAAALLRLLGLTGFAVCTLSVPPVGHHAYHPATRRKAS